MTYYTHTSKNDKPLIVMNNISIKKDNEIIIKNLSLKIFEGKIIGLIGANGAGKTTLLSTLGNIIQPSEGTIIFNTNKIGISTKTPGFFPYLSIQDNLKYFAKFNQASSEKVIEIIKEMDFINIKKKKAKNLSLGMQQKLRISISLLGDNKVLLLDEPFNGLDINNIEKIKQKILSLKEKNRTLIISSHSFLNTLDIFDNFIFMKNGQAYMYSLEELDVKNENELFNKFEVMINGY